MSRFETLDFPYGREATMLKEMNVRTKIKIDRRYLRSTRLQFKRKIGSAINLLEETTLSAEAEKILKLLKEIRVSANLGSGVKVESGVFYIGRGLIERSSREYLASSILHDCYHIHQFMNHLDGYQAWFRYGKMNSQEHASNERGALRFQLKWATALGLSRYEIDYLAGLLQNPAYQKIPQRKRTW